MKENFTKILKDLETNLDSLESNTDNILLSTELCVKLLKVTLTEIRNVVVDSKFESQEDEIHFFKEIKPKIYSKLIYLSSSSAFFFGIASSGTKFLIQFLTKAIVGLQSYIVPTYTPAPNPHKNCHIIINKYILIFI